MILDSHAHLDMPAFDSDRKEVILRARDAGLEYIVTIATASPDGSSIERTFQLVEDFGFIYAGIGVHPHDARLADDALFRKLEDLAAHPKAVLWGEIGLDYYYDNSPREIQRGIFRTQMQMARNLKLPVTIHCRDAWPDLIKILSEEWRSANCGGILHSFTGTKEQALECATLGFLVSFSGIVTFKNAEGLRDAARALSLDQILIETDCPYLAPPPHRGQRNEPAFVVDVARSLARTKDVSYEHLSAQAVSNFRRLIGRKAELISG